MPPVDFNPAIETAPRKLAPLGTRGPANAVAEEFEAAFLAEMLKHAGFDTAIAQDSGFGGEAMASFLVNELAQRLAEKEDFGIAAAIGANASVKR